MAPEKSDQPGVLGNLPRSRPGQRSEKRSGSGATAAKTTAAKPATSRSDAATERKAAAARKRAAARKPSPARRRAATSTTPAPEAAEPARRPADPLTTAFHVAGKVAELGLKTAGGIIRRLPGL